MLIYRKFVSHKRLEIPGAFHQREGHVYAILCRGARVKIGSSRNPRVRIGEQTRYHEGQRVFWERRYTRDQVAHPVYAVLISEQRRDFRKIEKLLHRILNPLRVYRSHNSEEYFLSRAILGALTAAFRSEFASEQIALLKAVAAQALEEAAA